MEKNNLHYQYFTFSPISEKPIKAVIRHLPPDTPAEDIFDSFEYLSFNVIKVRQMTATRRATHGQAYVEPHALFLLILTRNKKPQEILKLKRLNRIIIKTELYRAQIGLTQCYNCQKFGHFWANCKQPFYVCGAMVATCIGNAL
jgi:hypothetical protein